MAADTKSINIKNHTYYFFDDMINLKNSDSSLLKIDKELYKDMDIYYIGYITIKKNWWLWKYLQCKSIIGEVDGHIEEKNGNKYLVFDSTGESKEVLKNI